MGEILDEILGAPSRENSGAKIQNKPVNYYCLQAYFYSYRDILLLTHILLLQPGHVTLYEKPSIWLS